MQVFFFYIIELSLMVPVTELAPTDPCALTLRLRVFDSLGGISSPRLSPQEWKTMKPRVTGKLRFFFLL